MSKSRVFTFRVAFFEGIRIMGNRNGNEKAKDERKERNGYSDMCINNSGYCGYHFL